MPDTITYITQSLKRQCNIKHIEVYLYIKAFVIKLINSALPRSYSITKLLWNPVLHQRDLHSVGLPGGKKAILLRIFGEKEEGR